MDMNNIRVYFTKLHEDAKVPTYAKEGDCCCDLYSLEDVKIKSKDWTLVDTGIAIELPQGFEAQIRSRSGNAFKHGVFVLNAPGTIDEGYRDSIRVILMNLGPLPYMVEKGDRIAQMKFSPVYKGYFLERTYLSDSDRGTGGFGHTGR
jgi:dUTP pyrophosphatase